MAFKVLSSLILLGNLYSNLAAPAVVDNPTTQSTPTTSANSKPSLPRLYQYLDVGIDDIDSFLLSPAAEPSTSSASTSFMPGDGQFAFSFSFLTSLIPTSTSDEATMTVTITEKQPTTITVSAPMITVTDIITPTQAPSPTTAAPDSGMGPAKEIWVAPAKLSDLTSFQVSKFAGGEKNMKVVTGIPAKASASATFKDSSVAAEQKKVTPQWDNASSALQLLYPAHSIDPGQKLKPQGGAEFYASPIDISDAQNVTLRYSVFFPANFDWVLAGKLPGVYGGHTGCSGGNAALDCFSTRLMWRQDGAGELYLYAPKDKQTDDLCSDIGSVCDATYGLSIGRGSFTWTAGAWTTIQQTIYLNTPGRQDGSFVLDVNGETVINRDDIFYREDLVRSGKGGKPAKATHPPTKTKSAKHAKPTTTTTTDDGGLLGPILGGLLGGLRRDDNHGNTEGQDLQESDLDNGDASVAPTAVGRGSQVITPISPGPTLSSAQPTATTDDQADSFGIQSVKETEVRFVGIFFSTFFGGHEDKYATPRDQYIWFKDFALAYNS